LIVRVATERLTPVSYVPSICDIETGAVSTDGISAEVDNVDESAKRITSVVLLIRLPLFRA